MAQRPGLLLAVLAFAGSVPIRAYAASPLDQPFALGAEYTEIGLGPIHGQTGVTWVKTRLEAFSWDTVEPAAPSGGRHTYTFACTDAMVREYQEAGFVNIQSYLSPSSSWASVSSRDVMPKPEYLDDYRDFVTALVERYDGDGRNDMPGLIAPIRIYVVGGEWTGFWGSGNAADYLKLLEISAQAIRAADPAAKVGLIPFLLFDVFQGNTPTDAQVADRLKDPPPGWRNSTAGMLAMLDRPELFDYVDVHALGDYTELPPTIAWLKARMSELGYQKPVFIDDAYPASYFANDPPFTNEHWPSIYPVVESQYTRLFRTLSDVAAYREPAYSTAVAWVRAQTAASLVKKVVVAAAEGYAGIQIGNLEDWMLDEGTGTPGRQGFVDLIGAVAMSGLVDVRHPFGYDTCLARIAGGPRPGWQSLGLVARKLDGFESIEAVAGLPAGVWAYRVRKGDRTSTVLWYESRTLPLPGEPEPSVVVDVPFPGASAVNVTTSVPDSGWSEPPVSTLPVTGGSLRLTITRTPLFVESADGTAETTLLVPIVLEAPGLAGSLFTSELTLANRGTSSATVRLTYTPAFGTGGGTVVDTLPAGRQQVVPNAIAYLRSRGLPIPETGTQGGTLTAAFGGTTSGSVVAATVRTTTPTADGRASLAYAGEPRTRGLHAPVYLWGLRQNGQDRSNVAVLNAGATPITLRLTVISANASAPLFRVLPDIRLGPGQLSQVSGVLGQGGLTLTSGAVRVERVAGSAPFLAYAVINDQVTSDGSYVPPWPWTGWSRRLVLPAVVETDAFTTEVTLANPWSSARRIRLTYVANAVSAPASAATLDVSLGALEQLVVPGFVQLLRERGVAGVGPRGATFAGALFVTSADGNPLDGIYVAGRTLTSGGAGRYGLAYAAVPEEETARREAWVYGLKQDAENRSNLAIVNLGDAAATFDVELFDGDTGAPAGVLRGVAVGPLGWTQLGSVLTSATSRVTNGCARVVRAAGSGRLLAYGVVNDGGRPGERSGDGAFLRMATP